MNLATSTCLFPSRRQGGRTPMLESIDLCHAAGFRVIDLNFCGAGLRKSGHELCQDNWEEWVDEVGNHAAKLGVTFSQSHTPFDSNLYRVDVAPLSDEYREWYRESVRRTIIASARLGVKWVTNHAQTATEYAEMNFEENLRANLDFFGWQVELTAKHGTGIAVENMAEFNPVKTKRRFTAVVEEQIAIVDAINDPACGACWDFGHAEMVYHRDQTVPLRKLGHRLKATHVQENDKFHDDHFIPFVRGTTPWEKIMPLLKEIGYTGDFTYECHGFMAGVPDELRPAAAKFAYEVGMYCVGLYEKA